LIGDGTASSRREQAALTNLMKGKSERVKQKLLALIALTAVATFIPQCQSASRTTIDGSRAKQIPPSPQAQQTNAFNERSFTNPDYGSMRYLLFVPNGYRKQQKYPLILWLHGGGSRGDDLKLLLAHGDQHGIGFLARADNQTKFPSLIVAPQCPGNRFFSDSNSEQPTNEMKKVLEILDKVQAEYSVDEQRVYEMGMSMGGYAAWDIITRRPGKFAAAVPICGGGNAGRVNAIGKTAVWAFHGDEDEMVDVSESRKMVAALKKAGANPRYTEYKGVGHNSWVQAFREPDLLSWMFAQRK
jgi:predicted peptidase